MAPIRQKSASSASRSILVRKLLSIRTSVQLQQWENEFFSQTTSPLASADLSPVLYAYGKIGVGPSDRVWQIWSSQFRDLIGFRAVRAVPSAESGRSVHELNQHQQVLSPADLVQIVIALGRLKTWACRGSCLEPSVKDVLEEVLARLSLSMEDSLEEHLLTLTGPQLAFSLHALARLGMRPAKLFLESFQRAAVARLEAQVEKASERTESGAERFFRAAPKDDSVSSARENCSNDVFMDGQCLANLQHAIGALKLGDEMPCVVRVLQRLATSRLQRMEQELLLDRSQEEDGLGSSHAFFQELLQVGEGEDRDPHPPPVGGESRAAVSTSSSSDRRSSASDRRSPSSDRTQTQQETARQRTKHPFLFEPSQLSSLLHSAAKISARPDPNFLQAWVGAAVADLSCPLSTSRSNTTRTPGRDTDPDSRVHWPARAFANTVYSLGKVEDLPPDVRQSVEQGAFAQRWTVGATSLISRFNAQELANAIWGISRLCTAANELQKKNPNIVYNREQWGEARVAKVWCDFVLGVWMPAAAVLLDRFSPQQLSNVLYAVARLELVAEDFLEKWQRQSLVVLEKRINSFNHQELATCLYSLALLHESLGTLELDVEFGAAWERAARRMLRVSGGKDKEEEGWFNAGGFNAQDLANVSYALGVLGMRVGGSFHEMWRQRAGGFGAGFSVQGLASCAHGWAVYADGF